MLWACIRIPHLGLDSILRRHPQPAQAIVLVGGVQQRRELLDVNEPAWRAGLRPGMRLTAAQAIAGQFTAATHDPADEAQWMRVLSAWAYGYSSQVHADWEASILLEAQGSFALIGEWPRLRERLHEDLAELGFRHQLALAPTARGARVLAGIADGLAAFDLEQLARMLRRIPVRQAWLPDGAGEQLHKMGVRQLAQLFELPRAGLQRRFGAGLLATLDQMRGLAPELLTCYRPPDRFDLRIELNYEISAHQALLFPLRRMLGDLSTYLTAREGGVQRFTVTLEHRDAKTTVVEVGLLSPQRDAALLLEFARGRLERVQLPAPVLGMRLQAPELPPFVPGAKDLFDTAPAQAMSWPQLRERLRARLGEEAIYQVTPTDDPRPERAWRRVEDGQRVAEAPARPRRPSWLLERPVPLQDHEAQILAGPERLESGWWDEGDARRDYYVLQLSTGQRAWAFCHPGERGNWMLHGWFA